MHCHWLAVVSMHHAAHTTAPVRVQASPLAGILHTFFLHTKWRAGIAIGGDTFPGSTLCDHCLRYQNIEEVRS